MRLGVAPNGGGPQSQHRLASSWLPVTAIQGTYPRRAQELTAQGPQEAPRDVGGLVKTSRLLQAGGAGGEASEGKGPLAGALPEGS